MRTPINKLAITLLILLFVVAANAQNLANNTLTEKEKESGWKLLFNGKDFTGWKKFQGKEITGWKIVDGVLYNSGEGSHLGGDIVTREKFQDFELYFEWKITARGNSGIFYHVNEKVGKAIYESGIEYQLIDDKGWPDKLRDDQYSGANYGMDPPQHASVKPVNEWNQARILVSGTHVEHYLNGVTVVDYQLWNADWRKRKENGKWKDYPYYGLARKGNIGIQDHGGLTQFRNIKIRIII